MKKWMVYFLICMAFACSVSTEEAYVPDIQGHRGARGLFPENTLEGFLEAVKMGVYTLELDLSVSADSQIFVSHEPYLSSEFCADLEGNRVDTLINLYQLPYSDIARYDCGSLEHPRFADQRKMKTNKPLLRDVFDTIEEYFASNGMGKIKYNIELKTTAETDGVFHPHPYIFSDWVYQLISEYGLWDRVNIQSFDFRTLVYFRETYPEVKLALLIENDLGWRANVDSLGFTPEIYSCDFALLSQAVVRELQQENMQVIPWTVNEIADIEQMLHWQVDGIISDYPNRVMEIIKD